MKKIISTATALSILLLSSCVTKFTKAQKEALNTVAIAKPSIEANAYKAPYGGNKNVSKALATGGITGFILGQAVVKTQDNLYKSRNSQHFQSIQKTTPKTIDTILEAQLKSNISANPFFKDRLQKNSPNRFTALIKNHHLTRTGKNTDSTLQLSPKITIEYKLLDSNGLKIAGKKYSGVSTTKATTAEYAKDKKLLMSAYDQAIADSTKKFAAELQKRTAE